MWLIPGAFGPHRGSAMGAFALFMLTKSGIIPRVAVANDGANALGKEVILICCKLLVKTTKSRSKA